MRLPGHANPRVLRQVSDPERLPAARVHLYREDDRALHLGGGGGNETDKAGGEEPEPAGHAEGLVPRDSDPVNSRDADCLCSESLSSRDADPKLSTAKAPRTPR